ncbi:HpaA family protein [Cysteiniphilum marinum]|uniref:HpaA family protein n=1 Tax=Cysteiniphilum marinum TaxID=2774191 RepID=UPI00193C3677|nr:HpaA family protein [Cysteiniphilum marinum]
MKYGKIKNITIATSFLALTACSSLKVQHETGQLNLHYQPDQTVASNANKTLVVLQPKIDVNTGQSLNDQASRDLSKYLSGASYSALYNTEYKINEYSKQLAKSIESGLNNIYSNRGFSEINTSSLDELTYPQKRSAYLASQTNLKLNVEPKVNESNCDSSMMYCTLQGVIQVSGTMIINYIEPMTQEIVYNQKINLSDFNIAVPFKQQFVYKSRNQGIMDMASNMVSSASGEEITLTDNIDKSITEALNTFYKKAMAKSDKMISQKEILSYNSTVDELKNKKVF